MYLYHISLYFYFTDTYLPCIHKLIWIDISIRSISVHNLFTALFVIEQSTPYHQKFHDISCKN